MFLRKLALTSRPRWRRATASTCFTIPGPIRKWLASRMILPNAPTEDMIQVAGFPPARFPA